MNLNDLTGLFDEVTVNQVNDLVLDFNLPIRLFHPKVQNIFNSEIFWNTISKRYDYNSEKMDIIILMMNFYYITKLISKRKFKKDRDNFKKNILHYTKWD